MAKLDNDQRNALKGREFAFQKQRKMPIEDPDHVRNAIARFNQVEGVNDDERDAAWNRIKTAAKKHDVKVAEKLARER